MHVIPMNSWLSSGGQLNVSLATSIPLAVQESRREVRQETFILRDAELLLFAFSSSLEELLSFVLLIFLVFFH